MLSVSAVMPTRGRPYFAQQALESYLSQTYTPKRLYILDDAEDPSFPHWLPIDGVEYCQHTESLNIPQKRNRLTALASAQSIIMNWDSDDWSGPERMAEQVRLMEDSDKPFVGFHTILFYSVPTDKLYRYHGLGNYAVGTSLCFTRGWGLLHPFPEAPTKRNPLALATDNAVVDMAYRANELHSVDGRDLIVARIHPGNSSPKPTSRSEFRPLSLDALPQGFKRP